MNRYLYYSVRLRHQKLNVKKVNIMKKQSIALAAMLAASAAQAGTSLATLEVGTNPAVITEQDLKMYPAATASQTRHVVALAPLENEQDAKIELRFKKMMKADCNTRGWAGKLEEKVVQGWGYNFYEVIASGHAPTTMMACDQPATEQAVYMMGEHLVRYNSKLPIVVYTDKDTQLEVRVWQPTATYPKAS